MKEMIQARKEQLQERGVSGFTLMEMLIVVAIIAVLIAIAIPVFTAQLDKSKQAADEANARSIYAMVTADYMDNNTIDYPPTPSSLATAGTVTINGQSFVFSDKTTELTITTAAGAAPTVHITTNNDKQGFGVAD